MAVAVVVEVAIATSPSTPTSVAEWRNAAARVFGTPVRKRANLDAGARCRLITALPQRVAVGVYWMRTLWAFAQAPSYSQSCAAPVCRATIAGRPPSGAPGR